METLGYGGLDIDFEYIKAEDRDAFTEFVSPYRRYPLSPWLPGLSSSRSKDFRRPAGVFYIREKIIRRSERLPIMFF